MQIEFFSATKDGADIESGAVEGDTPRVTGWTLSDYTKEGAHPAGLLVMVRTKDHDYEAIITAEEIIRLLPEITEAKIEVDAQLFMRPKVRG